MTHRISLDRIIELEYRVLGALCCSVEDASSAGNETAMRALADYDWRKPEHRVVYEALARILRTPAVSAAEQLPAVATRMGFPDVNWELYLRPVEGIERDVHALIAELKGAKDASLL